jgi:quercetin dioxygenase-like cupin family protein
MSSTSIAVNKAIVVTPAQLVWIDVPLVQGGQAAVLFGNPAKAGTVIMRFKFPANRQTPPHTHPYAEIVTIISGSIGYGEGSTFDRTKGEMGKAGTFAIVPAQQSHFVWTENEEAVVQIQFEGPASTIYINSADDPRNK